MLKKIVLVAALSVASTASLSVAARSSVSAPPAAANTVTMKWPPNDCPAWQVCP
jgi:hypothetical protein